jgi:putative aminopeptidase FrvX
MLLKRLTEASGVSGNEGEVREIIINEIRDYADEFHIDPLGNIIATNRGKEGYPRIMVAAHMDEVGLIVKSIDDNGFIKFLPVGGIDDRILVSKKVLVGKERIPGVIGAKPIHLQEPDERKKALKHKQLYIDIGGKNKSEVEKHISIGDYIIFDSNYTEFGDNLIKAKALDDRAGCSLLIELLKEKYNSTICFAFTVQEELGLRGAGVAAYKIKPDMAIVVEGTTCHDLTDIEVPGFNTIFGKGTYYDRRLVKRLLDTAENSRVRYQLRHTTTGGNDAGKIHLTREGIPTLGISIPCRYIHSPVSVMSKSDYQECLKLLKAFLHSIKKEEF